jgi:hypothetical protein
MLAQPAVSARCILIFVYPAMAGRTHRHPKSLVSQQRAARSVTSSSFVVDFIHWHNAVVEHPLHRAKLADFVAGGDKLSGFFPIQPLFLGQEDLN